MNEIIQQFNQYPNIIDYNIKNPSLHSPYAPYDLPFYQTKETLMDVDTFRSFLKNAEQRFRASKEYKAYKSYLIENIGIDRCQILGNITIDDADIELHHNILGLFDICLLITSHIINTIGIITTFDLIELLIQEHYENRVGITFLSKTAHQLFTNDPNAYIPPEMTFGKWWELLTRYKYGITFDIANKVVRYLRKYQDSLPSSVDIRLQDQVLQWSQFNEYGVPPADCGSIPYENEFSDGGYFNGY